MTKKPIGDDVFPQLDGRRRVLYEDVAPEPRAAAPERPRPVLTKADVEGIEAKAATAGKPKGRPSLGEPWLALGISRRQYFKQRALASQ